MWSEIILFKHEKIILVEMWWNLDSSPVSFYYFFKECKLYSNFNGDIFDDYIFT